MAQDFGMKVSRQGFDVASAADHQLLFSSAFRMPMVLYNISYTITDHSVDQTLFTHGLGYVPGFMLFARSQQSNVDVLHLDNDQTDVQGRIFVDSNIVWYHGGQWSFDPIPIQVFLFNFDLQTSYDAPIINNTSSTQSVYNNDYGFKVSAAGADVKTAGLSDLQAFSGVSSGGQPVRSQIVHSVHTQTTANGATATISHGLGYEPMFLCFIKDPTLGYFINSVTYKVNSLTSLTEQWRSWADSSNIYFRNNSGRSVDTASIIFKDPLF